MSEECKRLHALFNGMKRFSFPFDESQIPSDGIYVLFEKGELAHGLDRIVRVGTHTGEEQLCSRLTQHFLSENKDRSIFRKNIGRALLSKANDPFLQQWELDLTPRKSREKFSPQVDFEKQRQVERQVSECIRNNFSFACFRLENAKERLLLESKLISTVSLCKECSPSKEWLGLRSPKQKIRESGLWLVNELYKQPLSLEDLPNLESLLA